MIWTFLKKTRCLCLLLLSLLLVQVHADETNVKKNFTGASSEKHEKSKGRLLGYIKLRALSPTINKYLKLFESVAPQQSAMLSLMLMGTLGGADCPGVSTADNLCVCFFPNLKGGVSPVLLINAKEEAHLIKIFQQMERSKEPGIAVESVGNGWFCIADDKQMIKGLSASMNSLIKFVSAEQGEDARIQLFDTLWNETEENAVQLNLSKQCSFYPVVKPFIEEISGIGLAVNLTDSHLQVAPFLSGKPNSTLSNFLNTLSKSGKVDASRWMPVEAPLQSIGYCAFESTGKYIDAQIEKLKEVLNKHRAELSTSTVAWVQFFIGKQATLKEYTELLAKNLSGYFASADRFIVDENTIDVKTKEVGVYTGQWTEEDFLQRTRALLGVFVPTWLKELKDVLLCETQLSETQKESCKASWEHLSFHFDEAAFKQEGFSVHAVSISFVEPQAQAKAASEKGTSLEVQTGKPSSENLMSSVAFQRQVFFATVKGHILYANDKEDMERLISSVLKETSHTNVKELPSNYISRTEANIGYFLEAFGKPFGLEISPEEKNSLSQKLFLDLTQSVNQINFQVNLPTDAMKSLVALGAKVFASFEGPSEENTPSAKEGLDRNPENTTEKEVKAEEAETNVNTPSPLQEPKSEESKHKEGEEQNKALD